jgi:formate--tetrahydrofolate ligase
MRAMSQPSDIEIAQAATLQLVAEIARERLGLPDDAVETYGKYKAKLDLAHLNALPKRDNARLILVTAISPTKAGEGKTTITVGLGDGLNRIGKNALICLREPSLGPSFGIKGGAAGGGYAQVVPMEDINLHFTGDFHAISAANNLLAAMVDNHLYWGNKLGLDPRRVSWRRALDMNDRALRQITNGLGGATNGDPREDGFDITVASEVMAIFCLAKDHADLKRRLARIEVGPARGKGNPPVTAAALKASGAMAVLLKDALRPNLVQTMENNPALVHGGPFANIAHGCNSVAATSAALKMADYVVTEAGFGADLGAEKFLNIKCRSAGLEPSAVVIVATIRALKMHGGVNEKQLGEENVDALQKGFSNLERHVQNIAKFGVPALVAINRFTADTEAERSRLVELCESIGVRCVESDHWARGGEGAEDLANAVAELADSGQEKFQPLYPDEMPLVDKIRTVAREIYRADDIDLDPAAARKLAAWQKTEAARFPVCMAKTQTSFSSDPTKLGAPTGFTIPVRDVRLSAGAGFVVALTGEIMTMPGLPRHPAAEHIDLDDDGRIVGLS